MTIYKINCWRPLDANIPTDIAETEFYYLLKLTSTPIDLPSKTIITQRYTANIQNR